MERFKFKWTDLNTKMTYDVVMFDLDSDYAQVVFKDYPEMPIEEVKLSDGVLRQCTGLSDKNGKLIYEGDIVNWKQADGGVLPPNSKPYKCEIIWGDWQQGAFNCKQLDKDSGFMFNPNFMEIIGDIYD